MSYFQRPNTMRELLRAVFDGKPLVLLLETDEKRGALGGKKCTDPCAEVRQLLADASARFGDEKWNLDGEMEEWMRAQPPQSTRQHTPTVAETCKALFAS